MKYRSLYKYRKSLNFNIDLNFCLFYLIFKIKEYIAIVAGLKENFLDYTTLIQGKYIMILE